MKKSIFHVSLMIGLTTLFTACSHHKPSPHSPVEERIAPTPINDITYQSEWIGRICNETYCHQNREKPNKIKIPKSNPINHSDSKNNITEISLLSGENKNNSTQNEFKLTLVQEKDIGLAYYGYRIYGYNKNKRNDIQILYGINQDYINNDKLKNFKAQYKGENSFIYSHSSTENEKYADINLNYDNGHITGSVTESKSSPKVLFNIEKWKDKSFKITPTKENSSIEENDATVFDIQLINSAKDNKDKKYMIGSGIAETWSGVFFAEKQNETQTTKP